ncbi:MAG: cobalamin-binding protein [Candidatus Binatia bacterium]|nr:cobalamin-binding protein [Candidatus Binatia bacterium]
MSCRWIIVLWGYALCALATPAAGELVSPRIVSLAPSVTETVFALGAGEHVVGVCTFCDFPAAVERIRRVGSYVAPNVEAIVATAPDVVIGVPPNNPAALAALTRLGIRVVVVQVETLAQIETAMRTIAREAGREAAGETLVAQLRHRLAATRARLAGAPTRRVLMVVGQNPLIAVGHGTFLDELITLARGHNIAAETGQPWPRVSVEFILAKQPEVIIDGSMGSEEQAKEQPLGLWRHFPFLPAVHSGRLYGRRLHTLLRPGPRLADGLEELARLIHPEQFHPTVERSVEPSP